MWRFFSPILILFSSCSTFTSPEVLAGAVGLSGITGISAYAINGGGRVNSLAWVSAGVGAGVGAVLGALAHASRDEYPGESISESDELVIRRLPVYVSEEDMERLREENIRRKYQTEGMLYPNDAL